MTRLLTSQDVAERLQVPIQTLYTWRYRGEGPPAGRFGRHLRFREEDVDAWIAQRINGEEPLPTAKPPKPAKAAKPPKPDKPMTPARASRRAAKVKAEQAQVDESWEQAQRAKGLELQVDPATGVARWH